MPTLWKVMMVILLLCLVASIVIGSVKLATTPEYTLIPGDKPFPKLDQPR